MRRLGAHGVGHRGPHLSRRQVLAGFAAALVAAVVKGETLAAPAVKTAQAATTTPPPLERPDPISPPSVPEPASLAARPLAVNRPGPAEVVFGGPPGSGAFALTVDDGTCATCAAEIVAAAQRSGFHLTLCPNGNMGEAVWNSQADAIKAMAATGQVAICNHTWDHKDLTTLSASKIKDELDRNEAWIQERFGVSSRPFVRPPFGAHNAWVDSIAGEQGWTKVILWNATFGDSIIHPPEFILQQLQASLKSGTIMLSHANHPATASVMDQVIAIVEQSRLRPVTILEMLGADPTPGLNQPAAPNLISRTQIPRPNYQVPSRRYSPGPVQPIFRPGTPTPKTLPPRR